MRSRDKFKRERPMGLVFALPDIDCDVIPKRNVSLPRNEPGPQTPTLSLSPPKRFKLETTSVSLPTSPCAESANLQRAFVLNNVKYMDDDALKAKMEERRSGPKGYIILDCRPFMSYNMNHISGAINVNCSDRFNRRRLQQGKATLADLATTREGKEVLKKRSFREVIIYDDSTSDKERITIGHPLLLVLTSLVDDHKEPALLIGNPIKRNHTALGLET
ncbi:hypothetical protein JTB14_030111 [Gonioctena quinquepunctata]|nr:hypothetical protein JTB14_030111 [Gonioctena quinquepunctata]